MIRWIAAALLFSLGLGNNSQPPMSLEALPTGQYYYEESNLGRVNQGYILLRKAGHSVVGIDARSRSRNPCFRGFLEGDRIVNVTRIYPPYRPDSRWEAHRGEMLDLSQYQRVEQEITEQQSAALLTCLQFFSH